MRSGGGCCCCPSEEAWGFPYLKRDQTSLFLWGDRDDATMFSRFRLALALYWTFWTLFIGSMAAEDVHDIPPELATNNKYEAHFFMYVTYWTMLVEAVYLWLAYLTTWDPTRQNLVKVTWVLRNIALPSSVMVMCLYWFLVFDGTTNAADVHAHAINAVIMLVDLTVSRWPFYLKHIYMPSLYIAIYSIFNSLYVNLGGTNSSGDHYIYQALDFSPFWESIKLLLAIVFIAFPFIYLVLYGYTKALKRVQKLLSHKPMKIDSIDSCDKSSSSSGESSGDEESEPSPSPQRDDEELARESLTHPHHHHHHHHSHHDSNGHHSRNHSRHTSAHGIDTAEAIFAA